MLARKYALHCLLLERWLHCVSVVVVVGGDYRLHCQLTWGIAKRHRPWRIRFQRSSTSYAGERAKRAVTVMLNASMKTVRRLLSRRICSIVDSKSRS